MLPCIPLFFLYSFSILSLVFALFLAPIALPLLGVTQPIRAGLKAPGRLILPPNSGDCGFKAGLVPGTAAGR